ncbi:MAG: hypothetical protein P8078_02110 [bacterium]
MYTQNKSPKKLQVLLLVLLFLVILGNINVNAQMNARALGLGGAYTALARGVDAPLWNPANLGLSDNPKFSMTFIGAQAGAWNNSISLGMYNKYNGEYLTDSDIENILNSIPDNGFRSNTEVFINTFSFSIRQLALTIGVRGGGYVNAAKNIFIHTDDGIIGTGETYPFDDVEGYGGSFLGRTHRG